MNIKISQNKSNLFFTNQDSQLLRYEAQRRKFRHLAQLASLLFTKKNLRSHFKEITNLIILALFGSEEAYLDKKFSENNQYFPLEFDKAKYLEEINKIHRIVIRNVKLDNKFRIKLLHKERELINHYLRQVST